MATKAKEDERKFILECIEVYHSLPALWNVKSKDYSNRIKKKEQYEHLLRNFRKGLKRIKDSEKKSDTGADDVY